MICSPSLWDRAKKTLSTTAFSGATLLAQQALASGPVLALKAVD